MKSALSNHAYRVLHLMVLSLLIPFLSWSQAWTFRNTWGVVSAGDRFNAVAVDAAGNVYATGTIGGSNVNFGTGVVPFTGTYEGVVVKFSPAGACLWTTRFSGSIYAPNEGFAIATDGTSVYVGGKCDQMSVNGGSTVAGHGGASDGFAMKLDAATGASQWVTTLGGGSTDIVQSICIDNSGNMYASGYFTTSSTYPSATFGSFTRSANGGTGTDVFIVKLDGTTGAVSWVGTGGMASKNDNVTGSGLAYVPEQDAIVMTGSAQSSGTGNTATYSTTTPASSLTLPSIGGLDIVVLQLDASTGAFQNALSVGGPGTSNEEALGASYDASTKYVCMTGYFNTGALNFSGNTISPVGADDTWYAAYDPATASFVWARTAGGASADRGQAISANGVGSIFITGQFRGTISAPTATTPVTITSAKASTTAAVYFLRINSATGYAEGQSTPTGTPSTTSVDIGYGVAASPGGAVWLCGQIGAALTFSPLPVLTPAGSTDIFLAGFSGPATLPVRLLSFGATPSGDDVLVSWKTSLETDHNYFEIQRSTDGVGFTSIGRVNGKYTGSPASYEYPDAGAARSWGGKLFYRLKMISISQDVTYSPVVIVSSMGDRRFKLAAAPNPFSGMLQLNGNIPEKGRISIALVDMKGRKLRSWVVEAGAGSQTFSLTGTETLPPGMYNVLAEHHGIKATLQVVRR